jgi:polysaccharide deacetylase 2 family uncharacterized protein YibQ
MALPGAAAAAGIDWARVLGQVRMRLLGAAAALSVLVIAASAAITVGINAPRHGLYIETTEEPSEIVRVLAAPRGAAAPYRPSGQGPHNWPAPQAPASLPPARPSPPSVPLATMLPMPSTSPPAAAAPRTRATLRPAEPKPALEGDPAWIVNALPVTPPDGRPEIAIIIDDAGVDRVHTGVAMRLKGPLTISFLPYAGDLGGQARAARAHGHEIMLHVPMEPYGAFAEPEPNLLRARFGAAEIQRRIARDLDLLPGIVGINNHMGSLFTADPQALRPVMEELSRRGLLFVDSRTTARSLAQEVARAEGLPNAGRDIFLDHYEGQAEVRKRLGETERLARRQGYAIAIGHPRAATLAELALWLGEAESKGFRLVPVSAVVRGRSQQFAARPSRGG